jgi:MerR family transcriptional regulator, repressor of the yfmOP operon
MTERRGKRRAEGFLAAGTEVAEVRGERFLSIGQASTAAGVTPRTLRYYEELGLLRPSAHSLGGARRYTEVDLTRIARIRELQQLMGFNLDEIGQILTAEDARERIREEYLSGKPTSRRRRELLGEAIEINDRLRDQVRQKVARIAGFLEELDAKAVRYRQLVDEIDQQPARRR